MSHGRTLLACAAAVIATGCMVGPDYKRPDVSLPSDYRSADAVPTAASAPTYGDLAWWTVFPDPDLQELIRTALAQNYDVRVAASRILQAQSQVTIARSPIFPTVDGSVTGPYNTYTGSERPLPDSIFQPQAGFDVAWELDIWGRYRRGTEAAQAQLLASEDFRYGVIATLVAEVGRAYLTLRALDLNLEISNRTVASRKQSLELVNARLEGGVAGNPRRAAGRDAALQRNEDDPGESSVRSSSRKTSSTSCSDRIQAPSSADVRSNSRLRRRHCRRACRPNC